MPDCERRAVSRGLCRRDYLRWQRHGDPARGFLSLRERFMRYVDIGPGCWEWTGARSSDDYGAIKVDGRMRRASRVAYELGHGPIPAGAVVMHRCDNPPCVNPAHLRLGTQADNVQDALAKRRRPQNERRAA